MNKAADEDRNSLLVLNLMPHTRQILENEGFGIEKVKHLDYENFKISW